MLGSELLLCKIAQRPFHPRQFPDRPDCKSRSRRPTGTNHVAVLVGKMPDMEQHGVSKLKASAASAGTLFLHRRMQASRPREEAKHMTQREEHRSLYLSYLECCNEHDFERMASFYTST